MIPHTMCTISVRFLGLFLVAWSLPTIGRVIHDVIQAFCMGYGPGYISLFIEYDGDREALGHIGSFAQFGLGLYLFFGGRWVIGRITRGLDGACPRCGYDTVGNLSGQCPECGAKLPDRKSPSNSA